MAALCNGSVFLVAVIKRVPVGAEAGGVSSTPTGVRKAPGAGRTLHVGPGERAAWPRATTWPYLNHQGSAGPVPITVADDVEAPVVDLPIRTMLSDTSCAR